MQPVTVSDKFCYYGKHICNTKILKTKLITPFLEILFLKRVFINSLE